MEFNGMDAWNYANPMGFTNPSSPLNPMGFTNPSSPLNPMGFTNPSSPLNLQKLTQGSTTHCDDGVYLTPKENLIIGSIILLLMAGAVLTVWRATR